MNIQLTLDDGTELIGTVQPKPIPSPTGLLLVPPNVAPTLSFLDALTTWLFEFDKGTQVDATTGAVGSTQYPVLVGGRQARQFNSTFTNNGGVRFHAIYGNDPGARNFVFAGDLWVTSVAQLGQMELDNNQIDAQGNTYIYGCQCNSADGAWDVASSDPQTKSNKWNPTPVKGSPANFPPNQWLHFELAHHRDDAGNITYDAIHFNGVTEPVGMTVVGAMPLGWTPDGDLLVNFQINGLGNGQMSVWASNLRVARW